MSSFKRVACVFAAAFVMLSALSCSNTLSPASNAQYIDISSGSSGQMKLHEVTLGTISRISEASVSVFRAGSVLVRSDIAGTFVSMHVENGDVVKKGDVIAEFAVDYSQADLDNLYTSLELIEKQLAAQESTLRSAVTALSDNLKQAQNSDATSRDIRRAVLRLESAEIQLSDFLSTKDEQLTNAQLKIDDFREKYLTTMVYAPTGGVVSEVQFQQAGRYNSSRMFLCVISPESSFRISGSADLANTYRFNSLGTVTLSVGGNISIPVRFITSPSVFGEVSGMFVAELADNADESTARELTANSRVRLNVSTERYHIDDVIIVPQPALHNENSSFYVLIYEDGTIKKRFVVIGFSDRDNVQILDGLSVGQLVVLG